MTNPNHNRATATPADNHHLHLHNHDYDHRHQTCGNRPFYSVDSPQQSREQHEIGPSKKQDSMSTRTISTHPKRLEPGIAVSTTSPVVQEGKHGKARVHDGELSMAEVQQYLQARCTTSSRQSDCGSAASAPGYDRPPSSKRRRLDAETPKDVWEGDEDVRLLNKAYRAAEDALTVKNAQLAALRQELVQTKTSYERKESKLRQDLLFRHIIAREKAAREHEREKITLHRLVSFLKSDHEQHIEKLEEEHRAALELESTKRQDAVNQALKQRQHAQDREASAYMQVQHMNGVMEHASALAKIYEGDLMELQRLDIEEAEERDRDNRGQPPAYESLPDIKGYRTPYEAIRHQDGGELDLNNIEATITKIFMRELQAANRTSLALREHEDRTQAQRAGSMLFHSAMLAFATSCQTLRALLEQAINGKIESFKSCGIAERNNPTRKLPSMLGITPQLLSMRSTAKLPSLSTLGLPGATRSEVHPSGTPLYGHPIDLLVRPQASPKATTATRVFLAEVEATIAATDSISNTMYELCTHVLAALDVREDCSEKLCHNRCARLGTWSRLADDTLLQCLKRRLEATVVEELQPQGAAQILACSKCTSEHCGGYCLRLHVLSYNINKLKAIRRGFEKISSPTRAGMFFTYTWHWLKDTLESERQISANTILPPTRQMTPEMTADEMALAMQHSILDPVTAAAQRAIRREDSEEEIARRLQAVRNLHLHGPRHTMFSAVTGNAQSHSGTATASTSAENEGPPAITTVTTPYLPSNSTHDLHASDPALRVRFLLSHPAAARVLATIRRQELTRREVAATSFFGSSGQPQPDEWTVADHVPSAATGSSHSGTQTRPQLRQSARSLAETREP